MLTAHPSKSGGDWWHGTLATSGKSGFFPKTYVEQVAAGMSPVSCSPIVLAHIRVALVRAKALYSYTGGNADELPFNEGDVLTIIDHGDSDWWKAERAGVVFIVPAAYLEVLEG